MADPRTSRPSRGRRRSPNPRRRLLRAARSTRPSRRRPTRRRRPATRRRQLLRARSSARPRRRRPPARSSPARVPFRRQYAPRQVAGRSRQPRQQRRAGRLCHRGRRAPLRGLADRHHDRGDRATRRFSLVLIDWSRIITDALEQAQRDPTGGFNATTAYSIPLTLDLVLVTLIGLGIQYLYFVGFWTSRWRATRRG